MPLVLAGLGDTLEQAVELLVFFKEDKGSDGVGTQANKARDPAAEGPGKALLAGDIA